MAKHVFDQAVAQKVLDLVKTGADLVQCALAAGIDERTLDAWIDYARRNVMTPEGEWLKAVRRAQAQWHVRAVANVTAGKPGAGTLLRVAERAQERADSKRWRLDRVNDVRLSTESVDDVVRAIAKKMASGDWFGSVSTQELADELGVKLKTVQDWATDASRLVRLLDDADQIEAMRVSHLARLERISRDAQETGKFRDATGAIRVASEICGTIRSDTTVSVLVTSQVTNVVDRFMAVMCPECLARAAEVMGNDADD